MRIPGVVRSANEQWTCSFCGLSFARRICGTEREKPRKFCTQKCRAGFYAPAHQKRWARYRVANPLKKRRQCRGCSKQFQARRSGRDTYAQFCSQGCATARQNETHPNWKGGPQTHVCASCHKTFARRLSAATIARNRGVVFCSHACANSVHSLERGQMRRANAKPKPVRRKTCVECKKTKPITKFPRDTFRGRALSWYCLACLSVRDERRRLAAIGRANRRRMRNSEAERFLFSSSEWADLLRRFNFQCAYCGLRKKLEQDHVVPLSRGGAHIRENIVPACRSCNRRKSNKLVTEWIAEAQLVQARADELAGV